MGDPHEGFARLRAAAESGELDGLCRERHIRVLTVFGSAARGEESPRDLDIGVLSEFDEGFDILAVVDDFIHLTGMDNIDVVHLNRGGPVIRERALGADSFGLYESEPAALANAQMAAIAERVETDPMRKLNLELLAG
ncbi:nucleotidyltransferase family protein [Pseudonocardia spinosispora]|uniref:nucleotidyltransferase family protein n=1 Tax=Pseudonocardia spinosispora TaxID=103441 RepID=UPI00040910C1|nr:nucleotidyltransferase domain-containing protein [Pseudonocardia spinosispora]